MGSVEGVAVNSDVHGYVYKSDNTYYTTCRLVAEFFPLSDPTNVKSYGVKNGHIIFEHPGTQLRLVSILAMWDAATYVKRPVVGHDLCNPECLKESPILGMEVFKHLLEPLVTLTNSHHAVDETDEDY